MSLPRASLYRLLPTEQPNPRTRDIDLEATLSILEKINREDRDVPAAVWRESARIARGVDCLVDVFRSGGKAILVGAGTSGRLAVLEAAECPPTFGTPPALVQAIMAGGKPSVFRAKEGAEDSAEDGSLNVASKARKGDLVIGIAASGVTPFVHGAFQAARRRGCRTILITSNEKPPMREAQIVICPRVGPEVIAGSTRLKAATAAKMVLNMLTTAAMIRLGKVYDHWMVDLKPTSRKLWLRGVRIVCELGRVRPSEAERLFMLSGGSVKVAVLAARLRRRSVEDGIREAKDILHRFGGSLRLALEELAG